MPVVKPAGLAFIILVKKWTMTRFTVCLILLLGTMSCSNEPEEIQISYTGTGLRFVQCPLGGIGTGNLLLDGRGSIRELEIFNHPAMDEVPPEMTLFALRTQTAGQQPVLRIMEREYLNEYSNPFGKPRQQLGGLPRFREAVFQNSYPVPSIRLIDAEVPLDVSLEAWSPFIPVDPEASGLPAVILEWRLENPGEDTVSYSMAFTMAHPFHQPADTFSLHPVIHEQYNGISFSARNRERYLPGQGEVMVTTPVTAALSTSLETGEWWDRAHRFWNDFSGDGELEERLSPVLSDQQDGLSGAFRVGGRLAPGESRVVPVIFTWHIPFRKLERSMALGNSDVQGAVIPNYYATRFNGVDSLTAYLYQHLEALREKTYAFRNSMITSTVPEAVLDAAIGNMASLKTNLLLRDGKGHLHGFEGLGNDSGCCPGNGTHVWNYAQTMAALFPSLERDVRETGFGYATYENGYQCFRTVFPPGDHRFQNVAVDGQMGNVIRTYREWKLAGSNEWLGTIWPDVKAALEFAWNRPGEEVPGWMEHRPGAWDPYKEGVLQGDQPNTYGNSFFGANMYTGALYLGALKACAEMAVAMNEPQKSIEYMDIYQRGREAYMAMLWNGEYFEQQVEIPEDVTVPGRLLQKNRGKRDSLPKYQYGKGCLSDQLLGQYLAFNSGLGYLLDTSVVQRTLKSIYRYNFRQELRDVENVQRIYAVNGESGLVLCTWPKGGKPVLPMVHAEEVWTGTEYQVAASLIRTGLTEEGVSLVESTRDRYSGNNRNPFAETESGRYYARALASWAVYEAMAGYRFDGTRNQMQFAPAEDVLPMRFFWSTATGWGTFKASRARIELTCLHGELNINQLNLRGKSFFVFREFIPNLPVDIHYQDQALIVSFSKIHQLNEGDSLILNLP